MSQGLTVESERGAGPRSPYREVIRPLLAVGVVSLFAVTGAICWLTHLVVRDQESRLLTERTHEVNLVLTDSLGSVSADLSALGDVLLSTDSSLAAFDRAATSEGAAQPGQVTSALLRANPSGNFVVLAEVGSALQTGQVVSGARAATMQEAANSTEMLATPVMGSGAGRVIGFALGGPGVPPGTVLYRQDALGPVRAPRTANTAPYHELHVALYASRTPDPHQLLVATTTQLPLHGQVDEQPLLAGSSHWLLETTATQPLVGSIAANAQWFVLGLGLVVSLLTAAALTGEARRRAAVLALYVSEHRIAETLQRSLLPELPAVTGLELATRYVPGSVSQEVGGDWFDVFELADGRVGVVIGDVVGHDSVAAAAMSQVRATLRAYGWQGAEPNVVLDSLDRLIQAFSVTSLVTLFYGVLELPAPDGTRVLRYANAGHLPPLVRSPSGEVDSLAGVDSMVIGPQAVTSRGQADYVLAGGSTLLLFTDGLVERRQVPLEESLDHLKATLAKADPGYSMEELCDTVVAATAPKVRHDDIAVLAIRVAHPALAADQPETPPSAATLQVH